MHSTEVVREADLWKRGVVWLLFLGPFFFLSYGFANWVSSQRTDVGVMVFAWESAIPLLPWTIIPYWSIDLLYGLSFLLPKTRREMDRHALRLLTVLFNRGKVNRTQALNARRHRRQLLLPDS